MKNKNEDDTIIGLKISLISSSYMPVFNEIPKIKRKIMNRKSSSDF